MDYFLFDFSGVQFHYTMSLFILYVNLDDQLHTVLLLEYIRPPQLK